MTNPDTPDSVERFVCTDKGPMVDRMGAWVSWHDFLALRAELDSVTECPLGITDSKICSAGTCLTCLTQQNKALRAELDKAERGVRVKPLEWSAQRDEIEHWGSSELMVMRIIDWNKIGTFPNRNYFEFGGESYSELDDAKAAAQADYERRILSALEPTPSEWNAAIEAERVVGYLSDEWLHVLDVEAQQVADRISGRKGQRCRHPDGVQVLEDAEFIFKAAVRALKRPGNEKEGE